MNNNNIQKVSIRFFNDREVRAAWDETLSKCWSSVLDVVGVFNNQDDYIKNRNYWKYLKTQLKKEEGECAKVKSKVKRALRKVTDCNKQSGLKALIFP